MRFRRQIVQTPGEARWEVRDQEGTVLATTGEAGGDARTLSRRARTAFEQAVALVRDQARDHLTSEAYSIAGNWYSEMVPEGEETSDGRLIEEGALTWRDPPLPLMLQTATDIGHFGAELAGSIREIGRNGNTVFARGDFDDSEAGLQALGILQNRDRFGLSVDLGMTEVEIECQETDEEGWCIAELWRVQQGELIGATMTPFPAFAEAFIQLDGDQPEATGEGEDAEAASARPALVLAAAGAPVAPPAAWFDNPDFGAGGEDPRLVFLEHSRTPDAWACPLTVEDDGRVYGHVAPWDVCHIGDPGTCMTAPTSPASYAYFSTGEVRPEDCDCESIPTGVITMTEDIAVPGHAELTDSPQDARAHYDNVAAALADVAVGEDEHGIWFAGALRPEVTEEQIRALRGSQLSGDWRRIGGNLELVAALAVNVGGFPIPRARVASGIQTALVAAGGAVLAHAKQDPVQARLTALEVEVKALRRIAEPLRPQAQRAMAASLTGAE